MSVYQWLTLFGIPTIFVGCLGYFWKRLKEQRKEMEAVKLGVQALLRAQMISDWNYYSEKGYAPIYARDNFENCWKHYHSLAVNGVMGDIHDRFMKLPTEKEGIHDEV